ncbi:MAG: hypothetical protein M3308_07330 [Actinomycetota bacterium]|nr:hypothetical protein [Actinomycetota bacterium]
MIILSALVLAAALLLVWTGIEHLRAPAASAVSRTCALLESLFGVLAVIVLVHRVGMGPWVLLGQAALYTSFAAVLAFRLARADRGDCRCTRVSARVGPSGILRAVALALVSTAAAAGYPRVVLPGVNVTDPRIALVLAAAIAIGTLAYALPAALDGAPVVLREGG